MSLGIKNFENIFCHHVPYSFNALIASNLFDRSKRNHKIQIANRIKKINGRRRRMKIWLWFFFHNQGERVPYIDKSAKIYKYIFLALTHFLYDITKYLCGRLSALTPYEWGEQWDSYTQPMHLLDQTVD